MPLHVELGQIKDDNEDNLATLASNESQDVFPLDLPNNETVDIDKVQEDNPEQVRKNSTQTLHEFLSSLPGEKEYRQAKNMLLRILRNLKRPDPSFHKFNKTSKRIQESLMKYVEAQIFFDSLGFEEEEGYLYFRLQFENQNDVDQIVKHIILEVENSTFEKEEVYKRNHKKKPERSVSFGSHINEETQYFETEPVNRTDSADLMKQAGDAPLIKLARQISTSTRNLLAHIDSNESVPEDVQDKQEEDLAHILKRTASRRAKKNKRHPQNSTPEPIHEMISSSSTPGVDSENIPDWILEDLDHWLEVKEQMGFMGVNGSSSKHLFERKEIRSGMKLQFNLDDKKLDELIDWICQDSLGDVEAEELELSEIRLKNLQGCWVTSEKDYLKVTKREVTFLETGEKGVISESETHFEFQGYGLLKNSTSIVWKHERNNKEISWSKKHGVTKPKWFERIDPDSQGRLEEAMVQYDNIDDMSRNETIFSICATELKVSLPEFQRLGLWFLLEGKDSYLMTRAPGRYQRSLKQRDSADGYSLNPSRNDSMEEENKPPSWLLYDHTVSDCQKLKSDLLNKGMSKANCLKDEETRTSLKKKFRINDRKIDEFIEWAYIGQGDGPPMLSQGGSRGDDEVIVDEGQGKGKMTTPKVGDKVLVKKTLDRGYSHIKKGTLLEITDISKEGEFTVKLDDDGGDGMPTVLSPEVVDYFTKVDFLEEISTIGTEKSEADAQSIPVSVVETSEEEEDDKDDLEERKKRNALALHGFLSAIPNEKQYKAAKKTLGVILNNLKKPEERFHKFNKTHEKIQAKLMQYAGAEEFFLTLGFEEEDSIYLHFRLQLENENNVKDIIDHVLNEVKNSTFRGERKFKRRNTGVTFAKEPSVKVFESQLVEESDSEEAVNSAPISKLVRQMSKSALVDSSKNEFDTKQSVKRQEEDLYKMVERSATLYKKQGRKPRDMSPEPVLDLSPEVAQQKRTPNWILEQLDHWQGFKELVLDMGLNGRLGKLAFKTSEIIPELKNLYGLNDKEINELIDWVFDGSLQELTPEKIDDIPITLKHLQGCWVDSNTEYMKVKENQIINLTNGKKDEIIETEDEFVMDNYRLSKNSSSLVWKHRRKRSDLTWSRKRREEMPKWFERIDPESQEQLQKIMSRYDCIQDMVNSRSIIALCYDLRVTKSEFQRLGLWFLLKGKESYQSDNDKRSGDVENDTEQDLPPYSLLQKNTVASLQDSKSFILEKGFDRRDLRSESVKSAIIKQMKFNDKQFDEFVDWVFTDPHKNMKAENIEGPITMETFQGNWINSTGDLIQVEQELVRFVDTDDLFTIIEEDDYFLMNDYKLMKDATTVTWENKYTRRSGYGVVKWSRKVNVKMPKFFEELETSEQELLRGLMKDANCVKDVFRKELIYDICKELKISGTEMKKLARYYILHRGDLQNQDIENFPSKTSNLLDIPKMQIIATDEEDISDTNIAGVKSTESVPVPQEEPECLKTLDLVERAAVDDIVFEVGVTKNVKVFNLKKKMHWATKECEAVVEWISNENIDGGLPITFNPSTSIQAGMSSIASEDTIRDRETPNVAARDFENMHSPMVDDHDTDYGRDRAVGRKMDDYNPGAYSPEIETGVAKSKFATTEEIERAKPSTLGLHIFTSAIGLFDLATDCLMNYRLYKNKFIIPCLMVSFSILAPYFVSLSSWNQVYAQNLQSRYERSSCCKLLWMFSLLFPTTILYFIFLDLVRFIFVIFVELPMFLIYRQGEQSVDVVRIKECYYQLFGMDYSLIDGFLRQRAVNSIFFESIPQFLSQGLMALGVFDALYNDKNLSVQVGVELLIFSMVGTLLNLLFQINQMAQEATQLKENVFDYFVRCMNGRLNWLPFENCIRNNKILEKEKDVGVLDYSYIKVDIDIYCHSFPVGLDFRFTDNSIRLLINAIQYLTEKCNSTIKLGISVDLVSIQMMTELISAASAGDKVDIDYTGIRWKHCIEKGIATHTKKRINTLADGQRITHRLYSTMEDPRLFETRDTIILLLLQCREMDDENDEGQTIIQRAIMEYDTQLVRKILNKQPELDEENEAIITDIDYSDEKYDDTINACMEEILTRNEIRDWIRILQDMKGDDEYILVESIKMSIRNKNMKSFDSIYDYIGELEDDNLAGAEGFLFEQYMKNEILTDPEMLRKIEEWLLQLVRNSQGSYLKRLYERTIVYNEHSTCNEGNTIFHCLWNSDALNPHMFLVLYQSIPYDCINTANDDGLTPFQIGLHKRNIPDRCMRYFLKHPNLQIDEKYTTSGVMLPSPIKDQKININSVSRKDANEFNIKLSEIRVLLSKTNRKEYTMEILNRSNVDKEEKYPYREEFKVGQEVFPNKFCDFGLNIMYFDKNGIWYDFDVFYAHNDTYDKETFIKAHREDKMCKFIVYIALGPHDCDHTLNVLKLIWKDFKDISLDLNTDDFVIMTGQFNFRKDRSNIIDENENIVITYKSRRLNSIQSTQADIQDVIERIEIYKKDDMIILVEVGYKNESTKYYGSPMARDIYEKENIKKFSIFIDTNQREFLRDVKCEFGNKTVKPKGDSEGIEVQNILLDMEICTDKYKYSTKSDAEAFQIEIKNEIEHIPIRSLGLRIADEDPLETDNGEYYCLLTEEKSPQKIEVYEEEEENAQPSVSHACPMHGQMDGSKCPSGHNLVWMPVNAHFGAGVQCQNCAKVVPGGQTVDGCNHCRYFLCLDCSPPLYSMCDGHHGMFPFKTPTQGYCCNNCNTCFMDGVQMFGCRVCNYDLCPDCFIPTPWNPLGQNFHQQQQNVLQQFDIQNQIIEQNSQKENMTTQEVEAINPQDEKKMEEAEEQHDLKQEETLSAIPSGASSVPGKSTAVVPDDHADSDSEGDILILEDDESNKGVEKVRVRTLKIMELKEWNHKGDPNRSTSIRGIASKSPAIRKTPSTRMKDQNYEAWMKEEWEKEEEKEICKDTELNRWKRKLLEQTNTFQVKENPKPKKRRFNRFEAIYRLIFEVVSAADLITDVRVIVEFYRKEWIAYFCLSVCCAIGPYLLAYSSLGSYFLYREVFKGSTTRKIFGILYMLPICIVYFFIFDVAFMIQTFINDFMSLVFCRTLLDAEECIDGIFQCMGLSLMDSRGYRRLRTLSQLTFESLPQIILQSYILISHGKKYREEDQQSLVRDLYMSLAFAIFHTLVELLVLFVESAALQMNPIEYAVICMAGRFGWVPFTNIISTLDDSEESEQYKSVQNLTKIRIEEEKESPDPTSDLNSDGFEKHLREHHNVLGVGKPKPPMEGLIQLDYGNICASGVWKLLSDITYSFSDSTLRKLIECIGFLKKRNNNLEPYCKIIIGRNIVDTCSLRYVMQLLEICDKRIALDLEKVNWDALVDGHVAEQLHNRENPAMYSSDKYLMYFAILYDQFFLVKALLRNHHTKDITVRMSVTGLSCIQLAVLHNNPHIICTLIEHEADLSEIYPDGNTILNQLIDKDNIDVLDFLYHHNEFKLILGDKNKKIMIDACLKDLEELYDPNQKYETNKAKLLMMRVMKRVTILGGVKAECSQGSLYERAGNENKNIQNEFLQENDRLCVQFRYRNRKYILRRDELEQLDYLFQRYYWPWGVLYGVEENTPMVGNKIQKHRGGPLILNVHMDEFQQMKASYNNVLNKSFPEYVIYKDITYEIAHQIGNILGYKTPTHLLDCENRDKGEQKAQKKQEGNEEIGHTTVSTSQKYLTTYVKKSLLAFDVPDESQVIKSIKIKGTIQHNIDPEHSMNSKRPVNTPDHCFIALVGKSKAFGEIEIMKVTKILITKSSEDIPIERTLTDQDFPRVFHFCDSIELQGVVLRWRPWSLTFVDFNMEITYSNWLCDVACQDRVDKIQRSYFDVYHCFIHFPDDSQCVENMTPDTKIITLFHELQACDIGVALKNRKEQLVLIKDEIDNGGIDKDGKIVPQTLEDLAKRLNLKYGQELHLTYRVQSKYLNSRLLFWTNLLGPDLLEFDNNQGEGDNIPLPKTNLKDVKTKDASENFREYTIVFNLTMDNYEDICDPDWPILQSNSYTFIILSSESYLIEIFLKKHASIHKAYTPANIDSSDFLYRYGSFSNYYKLPITVWQSQKCIASFESSVNVDMDSLNKDAYGKLLNVFMDQYVHFYRRKKPKEGGGDKKFAKLFGDKNSSHKYVCLIFADTEYYVSQLLPMISKLDRGKTYRKETKYILVGVTIPNLVNYGTFVQRKDRETIKIVNMKDLEEKIRECNLNFDVLNGFHCLLFNARNKTLLNPHAEQFLIFENENFKKTSEFPWNFNQLCNVSSVTEMVTVENLKDLKYMPASLLLLGNVNNNKGMVCSKFDDFKPITNSLNLPPAIRICHVPKKSKLYAYLLSLYPCKTNKFNPTDEVLGIFVDFDDKIPFRAYGKITTEENLKDAIEMFIRKHDPYSMIVEIHTEENSSRLYCSMNSGSKYSIPLGFEVTTGKIEVLKKQEYIIHTEESEIHDSFIIITNYHKITVSIDNIVKEEYSYEDLDGEAGYDDKHMCFFMNDQVQKQITPNMIFDGGYKLGEDMIDHTFKKYWPHSSAHFMIAQNEISMGYAINQPVGALRKSCYLNSKRISMNLKINRYEFFIGYCRDTFEDLKLHLINQGKIDPVTDLRYFPENMALECIINGEIDNPISISVDEPSQMLILRNMAYPCSIPYENMYTYDELQEDCEYLYDYEVIKKFEDYNEKKIRDKDSAYLIKYDGAVEMQLKLTSERDHLAEEMNIKISEWDFIRDCNVDPNIHTELEATGSLNDKEPRKAQPVYRSKNHTVMIVRKNAQNYVTFGSGVLVEGEYGLYVLTAAHCCFGKTWNTLMVGKGICVLIPNPEKYNNHDNIARNNKKDKRFIYVMAKQNDIYYYPRYKFNKSDGSDFALIKINLNKNNLKLVKPICKIQDLECRSQQGPNKVTCTVSGYPSEIRYRFELWSHTMSKTKIDFNESKGGLGILSYSNYATKGQDGGPIISSERGKKNSEILMGIHTHTDENGHSHGVAITKPIKDWCLSIDKEKYNPENKELLIHQIEFEDSNEEQWGMKINLAANWRAWRVVNIAANSQAKERKVRRGWRIVAIDGQRIDKTNNKEMKKKLKNEQKQKITFEEGRGHNSFGEIIKLQSRSQYRKIMESTPVVLIDWSAEWCPPSRAIKPALEKLAKNYPFIALVYIDSDNFKSLVTESGIKAYPTFTYYVYDKKFHEFSGASEEKVVRYLEQAVEMSDKMHWYKDIEPNFKELIEQELKNSDGNPQRFMQSRYIEEIKSHAKIGKKEINNLKMWYFGVTKELSEKAKELKKIFPDLSNAHLNEATENTRNLNEAVEYVYYKIKKENYYR